MGVNPKCIDDYAILEWKDPTKSHIFAAKHKVDTCCKKLFPSCKKLFPSDDCASIWSWPPVKLWRHVKPKNWIHAQKFVRLMQHCSLNNAWTMLLSRFNNTCWIHNVDEYCSINSCSMLTKNNGFYNVLEQELTIVDEKSLLIVVNNDWTMIVEREQLWTMVVDNSCWQGAAQHCWQVTAQHCWQDAAQHCDKLLITLIKLSFFARVM